jgi:Na+-translocating ferredoxin:NAD+ oxidoreductase RnfG subunit
MNNARLKHRYTYIAICVLLMTSIAVMFASVSCTTVVLEDDPDTITKLNGIFPEAGYFTYDEENVIYTVYDLNKIKVGYAFNARGTGYSGTIHILVGLEDKETIRGIMVLSHDEYASDPFGRGPGDELYKPKLSDQFINIDINDCLLKKEGGQVDGLTEATVSCKAIVDAVRETALEKVELIK